jgi:hypothetical protein
MNTNNQNQTTATTQEVRQPIDRKVVTTEEEKPSVKEKVKEKVHRVGEKVGIVKPETKKIKSKEQRYDDGNKTVQKEVKTTQQDPVPSVNKTQEREHIHHGGHGTETRKVSSYDPPEDEDENDVVERKVKHREVGVGNTGGYDDKHHEIGVGRTGGNDDKHHEIGVGRTGVNDDKHELRVGNNDEGYDKHHELRVGHNKDGQNKEHKVELVHHKDPIDKHHEIGVKHQKEEHDLHHHHHHKEGHDKHHEVGIRHSGGHDDRQRVEIDINVVEKPGNFRQRDTGYGNVGLDARQHEIGVGQTGVYDDRQREGGYDAQRDIGNVGLDARQYEIGVGQTGVYDDRQREGGQGNYPGGFEAGFGRNGGHNVGVSQQADGGFHDTNFIHDGERQDLEEDQSHQKPMKKEIRIKEEVKRDGTRIVKTTETISPGAKLETDLTVLHNDLHIGGSNLKEGGNISGQGVGKTHPA